MENRKLPSTLFYLLLKWIFCHFLLKWLFLLLSMILTKYFTWKYLLQGVWRILEDNIGQIIHLCYFSSFSFAKNCYFTDFYLDLKRVFCHLFLKYIISIIFRDTCKNSYMKIIFTRSMEGSWAEYRPNYSFLLI